MEVVDDRWMIESLDDDRNVDRIEDPGIAPLDIPNVKGAMSDMKALSRPGLIPPHHLLKAKAIRFGFRPPSYIRNSSKFFLSISNRQI